MTLAEARRQTRLAEVLTRLPHTRARLADGSITSAHAAAAAHGLAELDRHAADQRQAAGEDAAAWEAADAQAAAIAAAFDAMVAAQAPQVVPQRRRTVADARHLTDADKAQLPAAMDPLVRKTCADDDRTTAQRNLDALVTLAVRACDTGDLPTVAAQRPHVIVIRDQRADAQHPDWIAGIGPVSSNTAELFACDADTTAFTHHTDGTWDLGHADGNPTRTQRLAVIARDKHCIGCGAPATRCQLHHII